MHSITMAHRSMSCAISSAMYFWKYGSTTRSTRVFSLTMNRRANSSSFRSSTTKKMKIACKICPTSDIWIWQSFSAVSCAWKTVNLPPSPSGMNTCSCGILIWMQSKSRRLQILPACSLPIFNRLRMSSATSQKAILPSDACSHCPRNARMCRCCMY